MKNYIFLFSIILGHETRCVFMVRDDDWDYGRSAGVAAQVEHARS
jgi:hypothetical protein